MHETAQIHLNDSAGHAAFDAALAAAALPGHQAKNLPGSWGAGHYTWDGQAGGSAALARLPGVARIDAVGYSVIGGGWRAPELDGGVKRTLLLRVRPGASASAAAIDSTERIERFEQDLLRMPQYMAGILNWTLGRCPEGSAWTHVWQQEFRVADDLLGEYMLHPYHWAWVDRWFDPEHPDCMVDGILCHAYCPMSASILAALRPEVAA